jgi:hypothetical protein
MLDLGGKRLHQNVRHPISRFYTYGNLNSISNSQSSCTRPITNFAPVLNPMTDMPVILHLPLSLALGLAFFWCALIGADLLSFTPPKQVDDSSSIDP